MPKIMGILNTTPDSFYLESRVNSEGMILRRVEQMIANGMDILDLGGYSTRPSANFVTEKEEIERISLPIQAIRKEFPELPISLDTYRGQVARAGIEMGVDIINDISGFQFDNSMFECLEHYKPPYILTHSRGTFDTMHQPVLADSIAKEVITYLAGKMQQLNSIGMKDIIIDPGFGFSKSVEQNYELLQQLRSLHILERPILVGFSRKSMIYKKLNTSAEEALNGTTILNTVALTHGVSILRVHDIKEAREIISLLT